MRITTSYKERSPSDGARIAFRFAVPTALLPQALGAVAFLWIKAALQTFFEKIFKNIWSIQ